MFALLALLFGFFQIDVMEPIDTVEIDTMPPDPFLEPTDIPGPDAPFTYLGSGTVPTWNDVYQAAEAEYTKNALLPNQDPEDATVKWVIRSGRVAIGEALKAMSGMLNNAVSAQVQDVNLLSTITDAEFGDLVGRINQVIRRVNKLGSYVTAILEYAIPSLQAQIDKLAHDTPLLIQYAALSERAWIIDNIFKPLYTEILKVQPAIDVSVAREHEAAKTYTDTAVQALGVNVLKALVPMSVALTALQTESDECVKPMCQTMGPNTQLGKFLKGLNIAADAALIAALLGMSEADLAGFIQSLVSHLSSVVGDIEDFLSPGGETVAGLIGAATSDLL